MEQEKATTTTVVEPSSSSHSEASNISATSEESPIKDDVDSSKNKEKIVEKDESETKLRVVLDLTVANEEEGKNPNPKKIELNLFNNNNNNNSSNIASESSNEGGGNPGKPAAEPKTFTCNFCKRGFSTSQALGGHQNAHKQERAQAKHRNGMAEIAGGTGAPPPPPPPYGYPYYHHHPGGPYAAYQQLPYYSSPYNRSPSSSSLLGVRTESMIHKPHAYHPYNNGYRYGHEKLARAYLISPSPSTSYDRLRMDNFQTHQISGSGLGLGLGVNPNNPIRIDNDTCNVVRSKPNEVKNNRGPRLANDGGNEQTDASGLDLNLRL